MKKAKTVKKPAVVSVYKDNPVISLPLDGDKTFSFGIKRAEAIVQNMPDIILFLQPKENVKPQYAEFKEYKGNSIIALKKAGKPFSFGEKKALAIKNNVKAIINFYTSNL